MKYSPDELWKLRKQFLLWYKKECDLTDGDIRDMDTTLDDFCGWLRRHEPKPERGDA